MMQRHLTTLSSKYNIYCAAKCINIPNISLDSQRKMLTYKISYTCIYVDEDYFEHDGREFEKPLFVIEIYIISGIFLFFLYVSPLVDKKSPIRGDFPTSS